MSRRTARTALVAALALSGGSFACAEEHAAAPAGPSSSAAPARDAVHRLNSTEYNTTVKDVLGTKLEPATASWRGGELFGFDNMASVLSVDEPQYERYFMAAKALSADVVDAETSRTRFIACDFGEDGCATASIQRAGLSVFRRPLTADELDVYERLRTTSLALGDSPEEAFELVLTALLSSAQFIYRLELEPPPASQEPRAVGPFDLANRLAYFLWSSAPDDELLRVAADASILQETTLLATVDRMLSDPKGSRLVAHFAGQWLGARRVAAHAAAPELYQWTPLVAQAAGDELVHYFGEFVNSDRSWLEFLKADINYVTEPLARYYGIPTPSVPFVRVEQHDDGRAGFLGLAGFLALSSFDRRTSPSLRGSWVSSNLLCAQPPAPPPDVPELESSGEGTTLLNVRQALEQHRQNPACAGCHALFDPYGLALEEYDAVGQYRTTYPDGSAIDATATLPASDDHPDGLTFTSLAGLSDALTGDPRFGACLAQKLLMYGLGRPLESSDAASLAVAVERWRTPGTVPSIRRLIGELVRSDAFRSHLLEAAP